MTWFRKLLKAGSRDDQAVHLRWSGDETISSRDSILSIMQWTRTDQHAHFNSEWKRGQLESCETMRAVRGETKAPTRNHVESVRRRLPRVWSPGNRHGRCRAYRPVSSRGCGRGQPDVSRVFGGTLVVDTSRKPGRGAVTSTTRPLVSGIWASVFSNIDTEKCLAGGRARHTIDTRKITTSFQDRPQAGH